MEFVTFSNQFGIRSGIVLYNLQITHKSLMLQMINGDMHKTEDARKSLSLSLQKQVVVTFLWSSLFDYLLEASVKAGLILSVSVYIG